LQGEDTSLLTSSELSLAPNPVQSFGYFEFSEQCLITFCGNIKFVIRIHLRTEKVRLITKDE